MKIRLLQTDDAEPLLAFESANRGWFEQHVLARHPAFYSADGVAAHIADYLNQHAAGDMHPCVLTSDDGAVIIGRANLRRIDRAGGSAEIGYRIARDQARQGLASHAVAYLQEVARSVYGLRILNAWITDQNLGSKRVMDKCGFTRDALAAPEVLQVQGVERTSHLYQCHL